MFSTQGDQRDPAEGEPFPATDGVGRPVATILTLRCSTFVAFELAREVYGSSA